MKNKTITVIGAGIGGITAAIHLAKRGLKVTVIEKNGRPGGRCDRISRDGHHFDTGPTLLVLPVPVAASATSMPRAASVSAPACAFSCCWGRGVKPFSVRDRGPCGPRSS